MNLNQIRYFLFISIYVIFIINNFIVFENNFNFQFTFYIAAISFFLFFIFLLLANIILLFIKKIHKTEAFHFIILLIFFLCLASSLYPNIALKKETLIVILFINFSISILLALLTIKFSLYKFFIIATSVMIIVGTLTLSVSLSQKYLSHENTLLNDRALVSKKLNIFVISFDGLSNDVVKNEILNNNHSSSFDDFILFEKFISIAQSTEANLIFETIGHPTVENSNKNVEMLIKEISNNTSNILNRDGVKTNLYSAYNILTNTPTPLDFQVGNLYNIYLLTFEFYTINALKRLFTYYITDSISIMTAKFFNNKYFLIHKENMEQYSQFINSIHEANYSNDVIVHMGHWNFTRVPLVLDKNCNFHNKLNTSVQNILGMKEMAKCSKKLFIQFISLLKFKKIYNNSIIIFKSDNGRLSNYYSKKNLLSTSINNSNYGYSVYRPFFMIKLTNAQHSLQKNSSIITPYDLANFFCNEINNIYVNKKMLDCKIFGDRYLSDVLYNNKIISNRKFKIFYDNGHNQHLMDESKSTIVNIINGDVNTPFIKIFKN